MKHTKYLGILQSFVNVNADTVQCVCGLLTQSFYYSLWIWSSG